MHLFEKNIKELGIIIPELPVALANYVPFKIVDNLIYISEFSMFTRNANCTKNDPF